MSDAYPLRPYPVSSRRGSSVQEVFRRVTRQAIRRCSRAHRGTVRTTYARAGASGGEGRYQLRVWASEKRARKGAARGGRAGAASARRVRSRPPFFALRRHGAAAAAWTPAGRPPGERRGLRVAKLLTTTPRETRREGHARCFTEVDKAAGKRSRDRDLTPTRRERDPRRTQRV